MTKTSGSHFNAKRRLMVLKLAVAAAALCIAAVAVGVILNKKAATTAPVQKQIVISWLKGYKSSIILPHCKLYFVTGNTYETDHNGPLTIKHISSEKDVASYFGFDPLKEIKIPEGLKNNFYNKNNPNENLDNAYFYSKNDLAWVSVSYMDNIHDRTSKTITVSLTYGGSDNVDETEMSQIYNTKLAIVRKQTGGDFTGEEYSARFTYNGVRYQIYGLNGVTQQEFVNVLTSIIRS